MVWGKKLVDRALCSQSFVWLRVVVIHVLYSLLF